MSIITVRPAPPPAPRTRFTFNEFIGLFTDAETQAIVTATMDPANWQLKLWYDRAVGANFIDVTDQRTIDGAASMVSAGLLTEPRKTAILAGQPPA